jgi:hypothetical protein
MFVVEVLLNAVSGYTSQYTRMWIFTEDNYPKLAALPLRAAGVTFVDVVKTCETLADELRNLPEPT